MDNTCSFADLLIKKPVFQKQSVSFKRWSYGEVQTLKTMFYNGCSIDEITESLNRTPHSVRAHIRKLDLKRRSKLSDEEITFLHDNYWLLGAAETAKKLRKSRETIVYHARKLGLKRKYTNDCNPPIPRQLLPYDMVKRVAILERDCPKSEHKVEDSVVIFYDKTGPSAPMLAMHLDDLFAALEQHFERREGVLTGATLTGYKR